jgi:hypothetical protein
MKRIRTSLLLLPLLGLLIPAGSGCSYSSDRPFRSNVRSICVKPFGSREFRRRIEMDLTEAVKKRIQQETPYKLKDEKVADTLLTGEVLEVREGVLGHDFQCNRPREISLTLIIKFQWKDLRTGKILVNRSRWLQTSEFSQPVGETEWNGLQSAVDRIAETLVEQLEEEW